MGGRPGEASFYVTILVIVTVKSLAASSFEEPETTEIVRQGQEMAGMNVGETDQM